MLVRATAAKQEVAKLELDAAQAEAHEAPEGVQFSAVQEVKAAWEGDAAVPEQPPEGPVGVDGANLAEEVKLAGEPIGTAEPTQNHNPAVDATPESPNVPEDHMAAVAARSDSKWEGIGSVIEHVGGTKSGAWWFPSISTAELAPNHSGKPVAVDRTNLVEEMKPTAEPMGISESTAPADEQNKRSAILTERTEAAEQKADTRAAENIMATCDVAHPTLLGASAEETKPRLSTPSDGLATKEIVAAKRHRFGVFGRIFGRFGSRAKRGGAAVPPEA